MTDEAAAAASSALSGRLRCGVVLGVREDRCRIVGLGRVVSARYAAPFPSPRTERVSPGNLVAVARAQDGGDVVVFRWYDAVVLGVEEGSVRLWEPAHGEVLARPRRDQAYAPGTRAYLSAGLSGADWWVAGPVAARAEDADVELGEVERFCTELGLWDQLD